MMAPGNRTWFRKGRIASRLGSSTDSAIAREEREGGREGGRGRRSAPWGRLQRVRFPAPGEIYKEPDVAPWAPTPILVAPPQPSNHQHYVADDDVVACVRKRRVPLGPMHARHPPSRSPVSIETGTPYLLPLTQALRPPDLLKPRDPQITL
ncbi:hypothetical protein BHM03_00018356 [Ensete ventricosum]|nr:hypothetical protein BHM03_00018356 [Ensete ventricosum]